MFHRLFIGKSSASNFPFWSMFALWHQRDQIWGLANWLRAQNSPWILNREIPKAKKPWKKAIEKAMVSWFFLHLSISLHLSRSPGPLAESNRRFDLRWTSDHLGMLYVYRHFTRKSHSNVGPYLDVPWIDRLMEVNENDGFCHLTQGVLYTLLTETNTPTSLRPLMESSNGLINRPFPRAEPSSRLRCSGFGAAWYSEPFAFT